MNQSLVSKIKSDIGSLWKENSWRHMLILLLPMVLVGSYYPIDLLRSHVNLPFLLLSVFILIYVLSSRKHDFVLTRFDILWIILLFLMFLSGFWAVNPAVSILGSFGWVIMYLYYKSINSIELKAPTQSVIQLLLIFFFFASFMNALIVVLINQGHVFTINGLHKNIFAFYLIAVFPFFLFYGNRTRWFKIFKFAISVLLILLLLILSARNALLMLFITLIFYLFTERSIVINKNSLMTAGAGLVLILILLFIPNIRQAIFDPVVQEFYEPNEMDRYYMYRNSIWLFLESPLTGVGLENWRYVAYQNGFEDFFASENILAFRNQDVHSVYAKLLAEIGIIGFILYFIVLLRPLTKNLKNLGNSTSFRKACIANLIVFLVGSAIFQLTIFRPDFFSPVMLIVFFSLAFISNGNNIGKSNSSISKVLMIILSTLSFVYFTHYFLGEKRYNKLDALQDKPVSYFEYFDKITNPNLKTQYKGRAILPVVADYALRHDSLNRAKTYYTLALQHDPFNVDLLNASAQFYLERLNDLSKAEKLAAKSLSIHKNYVTTKLLLANIQYQKGNYDEALKYLSYYDELKDRIKDAKTKGANLPKRERRLQRRRYQKHNDLLTQTRKLRNKTLREIES